MRTTWLLLLAAILVVGCGDKTTTDDKDSKNKETGVESVDGDKKTSSKEMPKKPADKPADKLAGNPADDGEPETTALPGAEEFAKLDSAFKKAQSAFMKKVRSASREEQAKLRDESPSKEFAPQFLALADKFADSETAFKALYTVARNAMGSDAAIAMDRLIAMRPNNNMVLGVVTNKTRGIPTAEVDKWLDDLIAASTEDKIRSSAILTKIKYMQGMDRYMQLIDNPDFVEQMPEAAAYLRSKKDVDDSKAIESMLTELKEKYSDLPFGRGSTIGKEVEGILFVVNHLSVGKPAPDISGTDIDGVEFKLSDYRGKVVMLDFWGDW